MANIINGLKDVFFLIALTDSDRTSFVPHLEENILNV